MHAHRIACFLPNAEHFMWVQPPSMADSFFRPYLYKDSSGMGQRCFKSLSEESSCIFLLTSAICLQRFSKLTLEGKSPGLLLPSRDKRRRVLHGLLAGHAPPPAPWGLRRASEMKSPAWWQTAFPTSWASCHGKGAACHDCSARVLQTSLTHGETRPPEIHPPESAKHS